MKRSRCFILCFLVVAALGHAASAQQSTPTASFKIREGSHLFTLQWIGWGEKPGKVQISKKTDSTYRVKGEQRDGNDFATIDGTLKVLSPRELLFEGTILTKVSHINDGKVCDRTGTYHFYAKDQRKYWRLQEMDNCKGGDHAVDYVDIFF